MKKIVNATLIDPFTEKDAEIVNAFDPCNCIETAPNKQYVPACPKCAGSGRIPVKDKLTVATAIRHFLANGFRDAQNRPMTMTLEDIEHGTRILAALRPFGKLAAATAGIDGKPIPMDSADHEWLKKQATENGGQKAVLVYGFLAKQFVAALDVSPPEKPRLVPVRDPVFQAEEEEEESVK